MMRALAWVAVAVLLLDGDGAEAAKKKTAKVVTGVVNLNTATARELELLPGIGQKAAAKIVSHRQVAKFARPEDLVKVKGFGKKRFEKLKGYLTVSGPTTLAVKKVEASPQEGGGRPQARSSPSRP